MVFDFPLGQWPIWPWAHGHSSSIIHEFQLMKWALNLISGVQLIIQFAFLNSIFLNTQLFV